MRRNEPAALRNRSQDDRSQQVHAVRVFRATLFRRCGVLLLLASLSLCVPDVSFAAEDNDKSVRTEVAPFLKRHCSKCHSEEAPEADFRVDDLRGDQTSQRRRWLAVRDQLRDGLMPPSQQPRPDEVQSRAVIAWITERFEDASPQLPNQGNLVPHELLFGTRDVPFKASPARIWRLSPDGYFGFVREVHRGRRESIVQPFTPIPERGIKDFAALYSIDEPSTEILLRNAEAIVEMQCGYEIKEGKLRGKTDTVGDFVKLMDPELTPTRLQLEGAIQTQFKQAIGRKPDTAEVDRLLALYDKCLSDSDRPGALKIVLQAVLLRADAMYRSELGIAQSTGSPEASSDGSNDRSSKRKLSPLELARSLSLALCDRRESGLMQAAENGSLSNTEQVAGHVRRILNDPKIEKPQLLRFFHEYFEYHRATEIFKDRPADKIKHMPNILVSDTDRLVQHILTNDKQVLRELLTTNVTFSNFNTKVDKTKEGRPLVPVPFDVIPPPAKDRPPEWIGGVDQVYGFKEWPMQQPAELPTEMRLGILMQPSWLVAFSTNFDNDPVRRGRWIRERLLGGTVPDLPIGIVAQVPDDKQRTFRDRLTVTRDEKCWKCHQRMDELGLPFENFDHYGRFRQTEKVLDVTATEKNVDKKGQSLGPVFKDADLNTTGLISNSGDVQLDGPVSDPRTLVRRLAASDRVRQVFIRHVFRFVMGRNETLSDATTLQAADRAYVEHDGSFKELLVSLLTSDSFVLRSAPSKRPPSND